jgi:hypothetical protein
MNPPKINLTQAALALIDLQQGIVGMELAVADALEAETDIKPNFKFPAQ